jgi:hypothetical protein
MSRLLPSGLRCDTSPYHLAKRFSGSALTMAVTNDLQMDIDTESESEDLERRQRHRLDRAATGIPSRRAYNPRRRVNRRVSQTATARSGVTVNFYHSNFSKFRPFRTLRISDHCRVSCRRRYQRLYKRWHPKRWVLSECHSKRSAS